MEHQSLKKYHGRCTCGTVQFDIETDFGELGMHGETAEGEVRSLVVKVHEASFKLTAGLASLSIGQPGISAEKHYSCRRCGATPFHRRNGAQEYFGINISCLENVDPGEIHAEVTADADLA